jgi:hypothetical protein
MATNVRPKSDRRKTPAAIQMLAQGATESVAVSESDIARRAFELYCARGGQDGDALSDWLRAEQELMKTVVQPRKRSSRKSAPLD